MDLTGDQRFIAIGCVLWMIFTTSGRLLISTVFWTAGVALAFVAEGVGRIMPIVAFITVATVAAEPIFAATADILDVEEILVTADIR